MSVPLGVSTQEGRKRGPLGASTQEGGGVEGWRERVMDGGSERWMLLLPLALLTLFFYAWFRVGSGSNP